MTRVKPTHSPDSRELDQFTKLGGCVFLLVVVGGSGGITAYLILWAAPWALELPLPIWTYVPFAFAGLIGPLTAFVVLCTYSRLARRLFFVRTGDSMQTTEIKKPNKL